MDHSYCQSEGCFVHIYCSQCTHCQKVLCTEHIPVEAHRCQTPTLTVNNGNNTTTTSGGNANGNGVGGTIVGGNSNGSVSNIIAGGSSSSLTSDLLSVSASRLAYRRTRSREIGGVISGGSSGSSGSGVGSAVHNAAIGLVGTDRQVSISSPLTAPLVSLTGGGGEMDPIGGAPELLKRPSSSDLIRRGSSLLSRDVSGLGSLHPSGYINRGLSLFASDLPDYMRQSSPPSTIVGGVARLQSTDSPSLMGNSLVGSLVGGDPHLSHSSHHLLHPTSSSPHMIGIPLQKFTRSKSRELAQLGLGANDYSFTSSTSGMASSSSSDPLHPSAVTQSLLPIPRHNRPSSLMTSGGNDIANGTMPASIGSPSHNPTSQMPLSIASHTPPHILSHHHHPTLAPSSLSTSHALAQVRNQFARSTSNDQHQHHSVTPTNETNVSETTPQPINHPSPQPQHQHQHQHHHQQQQTLQPPPASHTIHSPPQMKQPSSQPLPVATVSPLAATGPKRKSSSRPTKQHSVDDSTLSTPAMQPGDNYYDSVLSASVGSKKRKLPQPSASVLPLNSTSTSNLLSTAHHTNQHLSSTVYPSHPSALSSSTLESESMRMEHIYSLLLSYTCATPSQRPSLPPNASAQDIAESLVDGRGDELIAMWKSTSWDRPVGEFAAAIATLSITSHDRIGNESSTVGGLTGGSGFSYTPTITNRTLGSSSSALTPQPVHHPLLHTSTRIIEHLSRAFHMNALELSAFSLYLDRIEPDWINRASGEKTKGKEAANIVRILHYTCYMVKSSFNPSTISQSYIPYLTVSQKLPARTELNRIESNRIESNRIGSPSMIPPSRREGSGEWSYTTPTLTQPTLRTLLAFLSFPFLSLPSFLMSAPTRPRARVALIHPNVNTRTQMQSNTTTTANQVHISPPPSLASSPSHAMQQHTTTTTPTTTIRIKRTTAVTTPSSIPQLHQAQSPQSPHTLPPPSIPHTHSHPNGYPSVGPSSIASSYAFAVPIPSSSSPSPTVSTAARPQSASGRPTRGLAGYRIIRNIGRGKFGVCQLVECATTNKRYVLKCIPLAEQSDRERYLTLQEVETLKRLQHPKAHPFIVKYHENFLYQDCLYIVMQWCEGGDLHQFLRRRKQSGALLDETTIIDWLIQLLLAIRKCHDLKIIHRDIKSSNIFLIPSKFASQQQQTNCSDLSKQTSLPPVSYSIKLGDFGISKVLNSTGELAMSVVGTPYSMSPEVCENRPYSYASDIWAIGCVLYEMCVLKHAFDSNNLLGLVWKIVQESYPPIADLYSQDLRELVSAMLAKDPLARPTVEQILDLKFIKKRLKVQIQEKLRERRARRYGNGEPSISPTPISQQEESSQNIFDNQMSVSSYYHDEEDHDNEDDDVDEDEDDDEDDDDGDTNPDDHPLADHRHRPAHRIGNESGTPSPSLDNHMYATSSSSLHSSHVDKHTSASSPSPSSSIDTRRRPITLDTSSPVNSIRIRPPIRISSPRSCQTVGPTSPSAQVAKRESLDVDDDIETQELLRSVHVGGSRRPSSSANITSSASSTSSKQSFKNPQSTSPFFNGGSNGLTSVSSKRLGVTPFVNGGADRDEQGSPLSPRNILFGHDPSMSSVVLGGRMSGKKVQTPRDGRRSSETQSPTTRYPNLVTPPSAVRARATSQLMTPTSASNPSRPTSSPFSHDSSPRASIIIRTKEQAKAQAQATTRIVQRDSFPDEEDEDGIDTNATNETRSHSASVLAQPPPVSLPSPAHARHLYEDDGGEAHARDLTDALRHTHIRDIPDGEDGLGTSGTESHDDGSDDDLVLEQLQSQLHQAGDPDADDPDSTIFVLPSSSDDEDEDGEDYEDEDEGDEEGDDSDANDQDHNGVEDPSSPSVDGSSHPPTIQIPVTKNHHRQQTSLPDNLPSLIHRHTLQPLSQTAKNRAATVLTSPKTVKTHNFPTSTSSQHQQSKHANTAGSTASSHGISSSPRGSPQSVQPSLKAKFQAVKERCLRAMESEDAFDLIYSHFQHSHVLSPRTSVVIASPPITPSAASSSTSSVRPISPLPQSNETYQIRTVREMLRQEGFKKAAEVSSELLFSIEQLVYLQQVLDHAPKTRVKRK